MNMSKDDGNTMNRGGSLDIERLFEAARDEGALSPEAMQALHITDLGAQIQAGFGVHVDDVASSEVVLVTVMPDDSGSIKFAGNAGAVRDGHNLVIDALADSGQRDSILAHNRYLNGSVLYPYCPIAQAVKMDAKNYNPALGTPLYDQAVVLLGTVIAKAQEFAQSGVPARTVTLIITDGADAGSTWARARDVCALVRDMRRSEAHIVAAIGIDDGSTDFRAVFRDMGIEARWILTPKSDAADVRKAFALFSRSAVRASQGGASFSRTAAGGFGG
ncbi:hypothetical protein SOCEGT47_020520 [Sorangium cellulosum]|uniref:VWFA domain-containing protein n=1 Tax=Sorangium cellulosum TaxID=56 RepID=A0A4P2PYB6_SORCE|nr:hypothetical protein [Sorangium cellulosum]AUX21566.1 hypothetical protein SOCEGT47_020520 [Sorangium cellulosum]